MHTLFTDHIHEFVQPGLHTNNVTNHCRTSGIVSSTLSLHIWPVIVMAEYIVSGMSSYNLILVYLIYICT